MIRFISVFSGTALLLMVPFNAEAACTFLQPVGGDEKIVKKKVERPKGLVGNAVGRTNWNTDFVVDRSYKSFKLFFTADSLDSTSYPIQLSNSATAATSRWLMTRVSHQLVPVECLGRSPKCKGKASAR